MREGTRGTKICARAGQETCERGHNGSEFLARMSERKHRGSIVCVRAAAGAGERKHRGSVVCVCAVVEAGEHKTGENTV